MIEVKDLRADNDGSLQVVPRIETLEQLNQYCDARVDESQGWAAAPDGALVWKLIRFELRTGVSAFIAEFHNENGSKVGENDVLVVHSWPGANPLPHPENIVPDYSGKTGVAGFTNGDGNIGFGFGHGMIYGSAEILQALRMMSLMGKKKIELMTLATKAIETIHITDLDDVALDTLSLDWTELVTASQLKGVGVIWPLVPLHLPEPKYADCAKGLGWFGGTDHLAVHPHFQLVRKTGGTTPPVPGGSIVLVWRAGAEAGRIQITEGLEPTGGDALQFYINGQYKGEVGYA